MPINCSFCWCYCCCYSLSTPMVQSLYLDKSYVQFILGSLRNHLFLTLDEPLYINPFSKSASVLFFAIKLRWCFFSFKVVNVLKSLLTNLDEVKKEREGLENDLKSVNFDMTSKFLTALAQDGVINEEALSVSELDRIYGGLTTKVQESLKKQEGLLKNIQVELIYFK